MNKEVNVLAIVKGEERYVFLYDDQHRAETLRVLGRYAADPQLSFTWYDAAVMSQKIRELSSSATVQPAALKSLTGSRRFTLPHEEDII